MGCNVALSRLRRGDTTGVAAILASEPPMDDRLPAAEAVTTVRRGALAQAAICGQVLRGVLAARTSAGLPQLMRADSIMLFTPLNYADWWSYEIAVAYAHHGKYAAALSAVRRRFNDLLPLPKLVPALRDEGRWAVLAGDTASAIRAFRHYLLWRADPEPSLIAERDSVQAELGRLLERR